MLHLIIAVLMTLFHATWSAGTFVFLCLIIETINILTRRFDCYCLRHYSRGITKWGEVSTVRLSVCRMSRPNSRTEMPRTPTIGSMEANHTSNPWIYLDIKRSQVKVTRLSPKLCHIVQTKRPTKFKLGTHMEHEDPYHRQAPWPPRLKVKVAMSRDASERR